jgi:hypothetical protein
MQARSSWPGWRSSFASSRSNSVKASAVAPAKPAMIWPLPEPADLLGVALDDGLAHRDLAVARHHHLAALADRQDGRGVPAGRRAASDCGDMAR